MHVLIAKLREKYILHPYFVVLLFVLTEQKLNFVAIPSYFLSSLLIALTFICPILLFLYFSPATHKYSLGLWLTFLFGFIFFGDNLQATVVEIIPSWLAHARIVYFILIFAVLFSILIFNTYRKKLFTLNLYLNCVLFGFCLIEILAIIQHSYHADRLTKIGNSILPNKSQTVVTDSLPNIYFILTDGYTNSNNLKKYWGYDNQPFLDSVQKHDYYVVKNAKSNYFYTKRTLAALLNGQYLPEYFEEKDLEFCNQTINHNAFGNYLEQNGYETTAISPFVFNRKTDNLYSNTWTLKFDIAFEHSYLHYLDKTFLKFALSSLFHKGEKMVSIEMHKNMSFRVLNKFKEQISIPTAKPKLIYLHLFISHYPFIFTANGGLTTECYKDNTIEQYQVLYLDQIKYLNTVLLDLISSIEKHSNRPAIVLITGDHGARLWKDKERLKESYSTTTLFYFPNQKYENLHDSLSSVNLFKAVINNALDKKISYLPDTIVVLPDDIPYK